MKSASNSRDRRFLLETAGVVGIVAGALILGAALRTSERPPPGMPQSHPAGAAAIQRTDPLPVSGPGVEPPPAHSADPLDLVARSRDDVTRLSASSGSFTLQFLLACNAENLRPHVRELASDPRLYLLPAPDQGDACYRLCWGLFPSRETARAAGDVPDSLHALTPQPYPREVAEALP